MSNQVIMNEMRNYFRALQRGKKKTERERKKCKYLLQQQIKMTKHEND